MWVLKAVIKRDLRFVAGRKAWVEKLECGHTITVNGSNKKPDKFRRKCPKCTAKKQKAADIALGDEISAERAYQEAMGSPQP
jgi:hypothetical protein